MAKDEPFLTAPDDLARKLKAARGSMLNKDLARRAGWTPSKVSKIEKGTQPPTEADLVKWAEVTGASDDQLRLWQDLLEQANEIRSGPIADREMIADATNIRIFDLTFIPRFLQLEPYARAALAQTARLSGRDVNLDAAVAERMAQRDLIYDRRRHFEIIVAEPALKWLVIEPDDMLAQIDKLRLLHRQSNVRFGVLPMGRTVDVFPVNSFELYGTSGLIKTFTGGDIALSRDQVAKYDPIIESLWGDAIEDLAADRLLADLLQSPPW